MESAQIEKINVRNRISFFEQKTTQPKNDEVTKLTRSVSLKKFNTKSKSTQNLSTTKTLSSELNVIKSSIAKLEQPNLSKDSRMQLQSEIINFLVKVIKTNQQIDKENLRLIESISELSVEKSTQSEVKLEKKQENSNDDEEEDVFKPKVDKLKSFFEKMCKENEGLNALSSMNAKSSSALGRSKSMHALGNWKYVPYAEMLKKTQSDVEVDGIYNSKENTENVENESNVVEDDYNETIEQEFERLAQEAESASLESFEESFEDL